MSFYESAALFSIGVGLVLSFMCIMAADKETTEPDLFTFAIATLLFGGMCWCLIVGLHVMFSK